MRDLSSDLRRAGAARPRSRGTLVLLPAVALIVAAAAGVLLSTGSMQVAILIVAAILVPFVLSIAPATLLTFFLVASFLVAGMLQYFAKLSQAHWLPSLVLLAMLVRMPIDAFGRRSTGVEKQSESTLFLIALGVFVAVFAVSALANMSPPMQALVGARHYLFPLALIALLLQRDIDPQTWDRIWRSVPILMLLQFPVALYQYFFVARTRAAALTDAGIAWDAVVGTFGGDPDKGGASGALALFTAFGIATVIVLYQSKAISRRIMWASVLAGLGTVVLAEVKVIVIYLPLAILVTQRRRILRSPATALLWAMLGSVFVIGLFAVYNTLFWSEGAGKRQRSLGEAFEYAFQTEKTAGFSNALTGEVSRVGALVRWWESNVSAGDATGSVIGYGPAASKVSSLFGFGAAAKKHRYILTTSALSAMLWDLGLIGVVAYVLIGLTGFGVALRASNRIRGTDPRRASACDAAAAGILLVLASLPYNMDALNIAAAQAILFTSIGYAFASLRWSEALMRPSRR